MDGEVDGERLRKSEDKEGWKEGGDWARVNDVNGVLGRGEKGRGDEVD